MTLTTRFLIAFGWVKNEAIVGYELPYHHKDPFDRLFIAQSRVESVLLVSGDRIFQQYDCTVVW